MGVILSETSGDNAEHGLPDGNSKLVVFETLSILLQLLSIVFNGAIICTLCRRSLLKYPSNRFVFSLCLSHLFVSFLSVSISLIATFLPFSQSYLPAFVNNHQHDFPVSHSYPSQQLPVVQNAPSLEGSGKNSIPVECTGSHSGVDLAHLIMMHINFGVAVSTSITVALISAERYITIARPMRYKSIVTARRSLYAIICCWLLAALITMMPLLLFENRNPVCGTFSVPMESLATYFGVVFAVVTVFALAVMIVCYTHIFRIAKAKCQKVQIGHFTASTVSSISSDWPSSVYSSAQGQHRFLHAGSRIESSNSLLHWVLLSNLGRHTQPLRVPNPLRRGVPITPPATPKLPPKNAFFSESALNSRRESDETTTTGTTGASRNGSTSSSSSNGGNNSPSNYFIDPSRSPLFQYHLPPRKLRNRWKTYLQPNYNSPRKTIFTIMLLIGAVLFTQLPLSFVLFTSTVETTQRWFQFCISVLFSTSSVANPVLYGFLNRSIRDQLWRLLRRKSHVDHGPSASSIRKRKRGQQQLEEMTQASKGFLSSANQRHLQNLCRGRRTTATAMEIPAIKISRKESISSEDNSSVIYSATSTNSINIIDGAVASADNGASISSKGKMNQVQKRTTSSPYYRTVLLKKANNITKNKNSSLLPRLALPDVNVRRNSSGSIISIKTNGIMRMMKGKVKELEEEWSSCGSNKYEDHDQPTHRVVEVNVEMQTFRNYSTPDLQLTKSENEDTCQNGKAEVKNDNANDIEGNSQIKVEDQLPQDDNGNGAHKDSVESIPVESCLENVNEVSNDVPLGDQLDDQPGPSRPICTENQESRQKNLEACLSVESLVGVLIDEEMLPENFPRKPSQDSGADMTFSDEEEELPPGPVISGDRHQVSPVLLSAASLSSLPATLAVMLRTGEDDHGDDKRVTSKSASSLVGPLLFIEHPDSTGNLGSSQSVLYLPCSCAGSKNEINDSIENDNARVTNDEGAITRQENGVTVTITDSNSDTQLEPFNSQRFCGNKQLLQVEPVHYHRHHHPSCVQRGITAHKSKSESDICAINQGTNSNDTATDLKMRSNCHIDYLVLGTKTNSDSSFPSGKRENHANTFTLLRSSSQNSQVPQERGTSPCCSVWLDKGSLSLLTSSSSENSISRNQSQLLPVSQSSQWLSVMSIHSSCSSLSSTCPLRILDGSSKSDISDYDDFEDHIEI